MLHNLNLLLFLITTTHVSCFYNLCHSPKNDVLSDEECSDLFFVPSEKETKLGRLGLDLENLTLHVTPEDTSWDDAFLRISVYHDKTRKFCSKLPQGNVKGYCIIFASSSNETFLLEYKAEKLPEANSRKFLFDLPRAGSPLFPYIDFTDTSRLILKAQKYASNANITKYKIEAFKDKHKKTSLQDLRIFASDEEILYELYTYNDEGSYYFVISAMCGDDTCFQIPTPKFYIGRKSTRLVIGIVGASFILPFVLFVFHILTKKYPLEESQVSEERIAIAYKSTSKKHNEIVVTLAALLEKFSKKQSDVVVVDVGRTSRKFTEKCDSLASTKRVVYVAPPRNDSENFVIDKSLSGEEVYVVIFDYCSDRLPQFFENRKVYKLFEDFDKFLNDLDISEPYGNSLYLELRRKTEEMKLETEQYLTVELIPKIVVTEEPQEHESLL